MKKIIFEKQGALALVKLNRPEVRNAFDPEMIEDVTKTFKAIQKDKTVRSVLLSGEGPAFCAGADLEWMKSMAKYTYAKNVKDAEKLYEMFASIRDCDAAVVGAVHGAVFGGGLGLLAVCDIVHAVEDTVFCFSEVKLGLSPAVISAFVKNKMRAGDMQRYFLAGETFTAEDARRSGLIHAISATKEAMLDAARLHVEKEFLGNGPNAVRETKRLLRSLPTYNTEAKLKAATTKLIAKLRVSDEGQEGLASFFEKRKPSWKNK